MDNKSKKGQSILEYTVLLAVIVAAFVAMQIYLKRSMQGRFKQSADQVGEQFTMAVDYTLQTISQSLREEQTQADLDTKNDAWTRSKIMDKTDIAWIPKTTAGLTYPGYELTQRDYVNTAVGDSAQDHHDVFDSGQISEATLFE